MTTALLELRNCSYAYGEHPALSEVSLTLNQGEVLLLAGPNGAGKTTALKLLSGLLQPESGDAELAGRPMRSYAARERARHLAVVLQESSFQFPYTVGEVVRMGRTPYLGFWGFESTCDTEAAERAMETCDLTGLKDRYIHELSGGEKQRAVLARALAQEPSILMLDEPTHALDLKHAEGLLSVVRRIMQERTLSLVVISHDLNTFAPFAHRMALMNQGRIVREGTTDEILEPTLLQEVFGVAVTVEQVGGRPVIVPRTQV